MLLDQKNLKEFSKPNDPESYLKFTLYKNILCSKAGPLVEVKKFKSILNIISWMKALFEVDAPIIGMVYKASYLLDHILNMIMYGHAYQCQFFISDYIIAFCFPENGAYT